MTCQLELQALVSPVKRALVFIVCIKENKTRGPWRVIHMSRVYIDQPNKIMCLQLYFQCIASTIYDNFGLWEVGFENLMETIKRGFMSLDELCWF